MGALTDLEPSKHGSAVQAIALLAAFGAAQFVPIETRADQPPSPWHIKIAAELGARNAFPFAGTPIRRAPPPLPPGWECEGDKTVPLIEPYGLRIGQRQGRYLIGPGGSS
jgi:hypothetical protein